jgi:hypothetical protein
MASTYTIIGSQFHASNYASWLTTAYLITSTSFQPLYGRFSDLFGRRICFFICTTAFMIGCFGCAVAPDIISLILMRAVTGLGGGGLTTMGEEHLISCMSKAQSCRLTTHSYYHQLRHHPLREARYLPSHSEHSCRLRCHQWCFFRRCYCRSNRMALVFSPPSPVFDPGLCSRLLPYQQPAPRICSRPCD